MFLSGFQATDSPVTGVQTSMAFSELELKLIEQTIGEFCIKRSPAHLKDKLRLDESSVAKLKFIRSADKWRLYLSSAWSWISQQFLLALPK